MRSMDELSPLHFDVLREIGNIGQGNAATALSAFSHKLVTIDVPQVRVLDINEAVEYLGGPENVVTAILVRLRGDISGMMLTIMGTDFVGDLLNMVLGNAPEDLYGLDDMQSSFVQEMGNILSGSYLNAISALSGMTSEVTVPSVTTDMVGALLAVPAVEYAELGSKVMFIEDRFTFADGFDENEHVNGSTVHCNMILVPEISSLEMLFDRLKVDE